MYKVRLDLLSLNGIFDRDDFSVKVLVINVNLSSPQVSKISLAQHTCISSCIALSSRHQRSATLLFFSGDFPRNSSSPLDTTLAPLRIPLERAAINYYFESSTPQLGELAALFLELNRALLFETLRIAPEIDVDLELP